MHSEGVVSRNSSPARSKRAWNGKASSATHHPINPGHRSQANHLHPSLFGARPRYTWPSIPWRVMCMEITSLSGNALRSQERATQRASSSGHFIVRSKEHTTQPPSHYTQTEYYTRLSFRLFRNAKLSCTDAIPHVEDLQEADANVHPVMTPSCHPLTNFPLSINHYVRCR